MTTRIAIGTLLVSLALVACGGSGDKAGGSAGHGGLVEVRLMSETGVPRSVQVWIEAAARASGGRIAITPARYGTGDANAEQHLLADLQAGRARLGWVGVRAFDRVGVKSLEPLVAPLLIDSYPMLGRVFASGVVTKMAVAAKVPGVVVIGVLPGPFRRVFGLDRPLLAPADYRGALVGIQDSALAQRTLELFGATPRAVAAGTALDGLDGYEQQLSSIVGNGYDREPIRITANVLLWTRPIALVASRTWFDKLTSAQRATLRGSVQASLARALETTEREDSDAVAAICRSAASFVASPPGLLDELRAAVGPIYADLAADPATSAAFAAISKLKGKDPPAAALSCPAASSPPAGNIATPLEADASALDGEYAATIGPTDLPAADRLPEQYGLTRLVIDRGQFRLSHDSDTANWVADGTARIDGSSLTLRVAHAEDVGPHGVPDGMPVSRGASLSFLWQRADDGSLRLTAKSGLPALVGKPLKHTGRAPGQVAGGNPAALEGVWTGTATADDVIAHHDDQTGIAANTGSMRLTIHGNGFTWFLQAPDGPSTWVGTFVVAGDTIEFDTASTNDDAGSPSPLPFWVRWSARHGQLTFREAPGFSPESWTYHPWHRMR